MNELEVVVTEVKTYQVKAICPICKSDLNADGCVFLSHPAQYKYTCSKCNKSYMSTELFPYIEYKVVENGVK